jgi:hypothetical protein
MEGAGKSLRTLNSALEAGGRIQAPVTLLPRKQPSVLIEKQNICAPEPVWTICLLHWI